MPASFISKSIEALGCKICNTAEGQYWIRMVGDWNGVWEKAQGSRKLFANYPIRLLEEMKDTLSCIFNYFKFAVGVTVS